MVSKMSEFKFALENGRKIPTEDKIFGISNRAKAMAEELGKDKVVNGTIGALLDDEGNLMVLSSVDESFRNLTPVEYAAYAPIGGTAEYKKAAIKAVMGSYESTSHLAAVATPGGTGVIRNTIANYSSHGDAILTSDWHWAPYGTIAGEQGRRIETFTLFNEERGFNLDSFKDKVTLLLEKQPTLVIILNTPAHNPTGYAVTKEEWEGIRDFLDTLKSGKVVLLVDSAYIDFAGDEEEYRRFLPVLDQMPENVLVIIGCSMSKTFTLYGMRCGAGICIAKTKEIADEFTRCFEYSSRASWSNSPKAAQSIISKIYGDSELLEKVTSERKEIRDMLLKRGKAFEKAAQEIGLEVVPFDAGFFISIPHPRPDAVCKLLEERGIFLVPLAMGIRVSVASVSEEVCKILPEKILEAIKEIG